MEFLWIILALIVGAALSAILLYKLLISRLNERESELESELKVQQDSYQGLRLEKDQLQQDLTRLEAEKKHQEERLAEKKEELRKLNEQLTAEFQNIASKIVANSSKEVQERHEEKLKLVLDPLREKIMSFEKKVDDTHKESIRENSSLKEQILQLKELNKTIGEEARNLTSALKGDKKIQGDWGEHRLERILQAAGLEKEVHYRKQVNLKDDQNNNLRPDYIIYLPDDKNLIIDSKVSLVAYEKYYSAENEVEASKYLLEHLRNVKDHISRLKRTNYSELHGIQSPDYVIMYMPIDGALGLAMTEDSELFEHALHSNIVLVSNNTLLATLRTVAFIWRQDMQNKNALEIARQGGQLYDKFVSFVETLDKVGLRINSAQDEYAKAMNQLKEGKGNLIRRTEKLKDLGIKTQKKLES
ncbi:DNA recombination protein RmuC [bacterium]|nr:DNA recombination protein RmuC [bacterium]